MVRIDSVMETELTTASRSDTVLELAEKLRRYRIGAVVVVDEIKALLGIVTERDIVEALVHHKDLTLKKTAGEIMSAPVIALPPHESIDLALDVMTDHKIRRLPIVDDGKLVGVITLKDISNALDKSNELLKAEAEVLEEKANRDGLTGLYNKGYMMEQLEYHIELAKRSKNTMAVLMLDIDHFKNINDTHGHLCGDQVLKDLAKILKERSRAVNIAGRFGGEEFIIIGPISDHKSAGYLAERLRSTVEQHTFEWEDTSLNLTISIGVSVRTKTVRDATQLIKIADEALYEAKRSGRNRVVMGKTPKAPYPSVLSY